MTELALTYDEQRRLLAFADNGTPFVTQTRTLVGQIKTTVDAIKVRVDTIATPEIDYDLLAQKLYALQQAHGGISDIDVDRIAERTNDVQALRLTH